MTTTQPTTPTPPARDAPEDYTVKRLKALGLVAGAIMLICAGWWLWQATDQGAVMVPVAVVAVAMFTAAGFLWEYSSRAIGRDLPRQSKTQPANTGDVYRIQIKRTMPVGKDGAVDMEPDEIELPVKPADFVTIVRQMQQTGASRDNRPAGVGQPKWRKIMHALEDLGGAVNGPNGFEFTDDLDALLHRISQW